MTIAARRRHVRFLNWSHSPEAIAVLCVVGVVMALKGII